MEYKDFYNDEWNKLTTNENGTMRLRCRLALINRCRVSGNCHSASTVAITTQKERQEIRMDPDQTAHTIHRTRRIHVGRTLFHPGSLGPL